VENPKAKIIAVDDEDIILDSFRRILVLAGFSVDTVNKGQEAIGLVQKNDYDFLFTDLKMPEMDGIDVTKAIKHYRPDIDVIMITGFATIESAVEVMKFGAMDYVQKPFTEDELVDFVNKALIRRNSRMEKLIRPKAHFVTPSSKASASKKEFNIPSGVFLSNNHTWLNIDINGNVKVGIDDFAQKIIGKIDQLGLPNVGQELNKGDSLFSLKQGTNSVSLASPISGKIIEVNGALSENYAEPIKNRPYEYGWVCIMEAKNLANDLKNLKIGNDALDWYKEEINKYSDLVSSDKAAGIGDELLNADIWNDLTSKFLK
jgi:DNA-binding response OmpR family regulator